MNNRNKTQERPAAGWYTREELAVILDVGTTQVDRRFRALAGDDVKIVRKRVYMRARTVVDALVAEAKAGGTDPASSDPLLTMGSSPALERYRAARAEDAELSLAERQQKLVSASAMSAAVVPGIRVLRDTGDRLRRKFGNEAGDIYNEGIDEFEATTIRAIAQFEGAK